MPDKKKAVVPRLRFPEFRDAGPWEVKRLGELFKECTERGGEDLELLSVTISDGVVRASELERKNNTSADLSNYKRVHPGDIVYNSMRMWQGASGVSHWHGLVSPAYTVVTPIEKQNSVFWSYHFKLSHSIDKFTRFSQGLTSDTWNLKYPAFSSIKMAFPADPAEQQKIADCLSSLDDLIEAEEAQLTALREHKKGLLQQLFPREGETTPRLRFPEFRDAGPWEVKRLGELVKTISPPKKLQTSEYLSSGEFPVIDQSPNDICGWTNDETAIVEADFPLVIFGDHTCVVKLADGPFAQGADGIKILATILTVDARFLFMSLQADPIEQKGYKRHFSTLKEKLVSFPRKETGEQQKIADCLSSLDELIELQAKRLDAIKAHKKGLLQQLFPQEVV